MSLWNVAAIILVSSAAGLAQADVSEVKSCETWSLKGAYALTITGTRPAPFVVPGVSGTPGTTEQVTGIFTLIFDGRGGFTVPAPIIVKGALSGLFPDQPGTGTYTISADCTGRFSVNLPQLPAPLENKMVVLKGGKEFRSVVVSPQPVMITVIGIKVE